MIIFQLLFIKILQKVHNQTKRKYFDVRPSKVIKYVITSYRVSQEDQVMVLTKAMIMSA